MPPSKGEGEASGLVSSLSAELLWEFYDPADPRRNVVKHILVDSLSKWNLAPTDEVPIELANILKNLPMVKDPIKQKWEVDTKGMKLSG